jgi:hypothetical protein
MSNSACPHWQAHRRGCGAVVILLRVAVPSLFKLLSKTLCHQRRAKGLQVLSRTRTQTMVKPSFGPMFCVGANLVVAIRRHHHFRSVV